MGTCIVIYHEKPSAIGNRNLIVESTRPFQKIFIELNQGNARDAWQKYDSNERDFLVSSISCVTSRMLLVLYVPVEKKKKYMRHKER